MDPADEAGADNAGDVGLGTATDGVPLAGSSVGEVAGVPFREFSTWDSVAAWVSSPIA